MTTVRINLPDQAWRGAGLYRNAVTPTPEEKRRIHLECLAYRLFSDGHTRPLSDAEQEELHLAIWNGEMG